MNTEAINLLIQRLDTVFSKHKEPLSLHEPSFKGAEWEYVKECLDTGWVSSVGRFVEQFETDLAAFTGSKYAVAVANGTCALHVALILSGVKPNDEVLVPALTFVATANAVSYCGAVPHFVDSSSEHLGIDVEKLSQYLKKNACIENGRCLNIATGRVMRAIVPMHVFGHPVDMDALMSLAVEYKLEVIEDAAESIGSFYKNKHTGTIARIGILSFNGNKVITTGGGGALLTNDPELAKKAKHLTTTARVPDAWSFVHDQVGFNYRMPNINAALGCAQLEELPTFIKSKRALAQKYKSILMGIPGLQFLDEPDHGRSNFWLNAIVLDSNTKEERNEVLKNLNQAGYVCRPIWTLLHKLPMYENCPRMTLETACRLENQIINLPSSAKLGDEND